MEIKKFEHSKILAYLVSNIVAVLENNSQGEEEIERAYLD